MPACLRKRVPNRVPSATPATESTNVVAPMISTAGTMDTCKKANEMPTASASMLVASASSKSDTSHARPFSAVSSSPRSVSTIILPPMNSSSANTIQ